MRLSKLLLFAASLCVSVLLLEGVMRMIDVQKPRHKAKIMNFIDTPVWKYFVLDPVRLYKIAPYMHAQNPIAHESDEGGFRLSPLHVGGFDRRIVALGDSFTFGHGVDHVSTYPYQLEQMLSKDGIHIRVDNAGVPGYGLDQEYLYLQEIILRRKRPDVVIWNLNINDIGDSNDACLFRKRAWGYTYLSARFNTMYFTRAYLSLVPDYIKQSLLFTYLLENLPERFTFGCSAFLIPEGGRLLRFEQKTIHFFSKAKELSLRNHVNLLLTIVLDQASLGQDEGMRKDAKIIRLIFQRAAHRANVRLIDLNEALLRMEGVILT